MVYRRNAFSSYKLGLDSNVFLWPCLFPSMEKTLFVCVLWTWAGCWCLIVWKLPKYRVRGAEALPWELCSGPVLSRDASGELRAWLSEGSEQHQPLIPFQRRSYREHTQIMHSYKFADAW